MNMSLMEEICRMAGLPVESSKSVGPTTTLVFLGVELDSIKMSLSLPHDKLVSIKESFQDGEASKPAVNVIYSPS